MNAGPESIAFPALVFCGKFFVYFFSDASYKEMKAKRKEIRLCGHHKHSSVNNIKERKQNSGSGIDSVLRRLGELKIGLNPVGLKS